MSIKVRSDYAEGGAGLNGPGAPTALHRPIGEVLRGLIDDIENGVTGSVAGIATIASADATDLASAQTLVNEIKASLNAASAAAVAAAVAPSVIKG